MSADARCDSTSVMARRPFTMRSDMDGAHGHGRLPYMVFDHDLKAYVRGKRPQPSRHGINGWCSEPTCTGRIVRGVCAECGEDYR